MVYVFFPNSSTSVLPNLTQGALNNTVCPLMGNTSISSTPPILLAPIPAQTTIASTLDGGLLLDVALPSPDKPEAPP